MVMAKEQHSSNNKQAFWLALPDQTQGAVHLALQWLAYVYPTSELQIDKTLSSALPYADSDLTSRWIQFLDEADVADHVDALQWMAKTLSREQIPFLVETCWRLLLVDHEFPNHVPLALRLLGQILNLDEQRLHSIGEAVFQEYTDTIEEKVRAPLLPIDPRYLDRVEWRLYGQSSRTRQSQPSTGRDNGSLKIAVSGFIVGTVFGASVLGFLIFGPWDIGVFKSPYPNFVMTPAPSIPEPVDEPEVKTPVLVASTDTSTNAQQSAPQLITEPEPVFSIDEPIVEPEVANLSAKETNGSEAEIAMSANEITDSSSESNLSEPVIQAESPAEETSITEEAPRQLMAITASILNVRSQPSVDSDIVIKLGEGARVWAYPSEAVGMWMKISVEGEMGYASSRFMQVVE